MSDGRSNPAGDAPRPRLLFVVNVAWFFLSHRLPLALAARDAGFDVHVAADTEDSAEADEIRRHGFMFHHTPLRRGGLNPIHDARYFVRLLKIVRAVDPTLMHNVTIKPVLYGSAVGRLVGVTGIVNAVSGLGYSFSKESRRLLASALLVAYRWALRTPRVRVIFQNDDDARWLGDAIGLHKDQRVLIRGSGVDLERFAPAEEPEGPVRVLLPSRVLRDKGVVEFVDAAGALRARGCDARFEIAGKLDPFNPAAISDAELRALCAASGVEWLGHVADMSRLLREVHIVCLPSYREGLPKALIEACAAGRPIVTTDVPGCRDVVTHEVNGLLVPARSVEPLADALGRLISAPDERVSFGRAGRLKAEREYAVESVVQQTLALYRQFLGSSCPVPS